MSSGKRIWKYGGYKKDTLKENLTEKEEALLICEICEGIMREACLSSSGKQFCSCCDMEESKPSTITKVHYLSTYQTYQTSHSQQNPNIPVRKMVSSLKCSCPLIQRGCEWLGTLQYCEDHLDTCGYVRDECRLGCGEVLQRNEFKLHIRRQLSMS